MFRENFSFIGNYICRESIKNISKHLSEQERKHFSNHDCYYLTTIHYMGNPTFTQVAQDLGLTKPAITLLVKRFGKLNLVEKVQSEEDRRVFHIRLTEKGRRVAQGDEMAYEKMTEMIKSLLQNEQQYKIVEELLSDLVNRLKENME